MKDKLLMTSFYLGNISDIGITAYAMNQPDFMEKGIAGAGYFESQNLAPMYIAKLAITAGLVGLYALSKQNHINTFNVKWEHVFEKSLQLGNMAVWSAMVWNGINVGAYLLENVR